MPNPVAAVASAIVSSVINAPAEPPVAPVPVYSQMQRSFPAGARLGAMGGAQGGVLIDGALLPAAPGLQIRNQQNLIVLPSTILEPAPVAYQLDLAGNVWRVWMLTATEVAILESRR